MITKKKLLSYAPEVYGQLLSDTFDLLKKNKVKITISEKQYVQYVGNCFGFFGGDVGNMEFAVAVGNPIEIWMPIFIHESCHLDQFLEDSYIWETADPYLNYYFSWIAGELELSSERILECMNATIKLERDCEERTVGKIKKYNLPINTTEYTQRANTYLFAYLLFTEKRKFIEGLHSNKSIYSKSPKHFLSEYKKIPMPLKKAMDKFVLDKSTLSEV